MPKMCDMLQKQTNLFFDLSMWISSEMSSILSNIYSKHLSLKATFPPEGVYQGLSNLAYSMMGA